MIFLLYMYISLLVFKVALTAEAISLQCLLEAVVLRPIQYAATMECHATDTGHGIPSCHSIQTQGRLVVIFIDMESYTGIHNYSF